MEFRRDKLAAAPVIRGFSRGGFRVDNAVFASGILLDPERVIAWDAPTSAVEILISDLEVILAFSRPPEFLLLGTGAGLVRPTRALVAALEARGIGVEAMDSRAAARTWGVLQQEERCVVAALMPPGGNAGRD